MFPVQYITHHNASLDYEAGARLALAGGCRWIQLRMKGASDSEVRPIAQRLKAACREAGATFVIDDRVALAKELELDGVHLGHEDMPPEQARALLGEGFLIGGTANTIDDVRRLTRAGVDYIGCGPFRHTTTKARLAPTLGTAGYKALLAQMAAEGITTPLLAIGGITLSDLPALYEAGVRAVAVSGAVLNAEDPAAAMRALLAFEA